MEKDVHRSYLNDTSYTTRRPLKGSGSFGRSTGAFGLQACPVVAKVIVAGSNSRILSAWKRSVSYGPGETVNRKVLAAGGKATITRLRPALIRLT